MKKTIVEVINGLPFINGKRCIFETKEIREIIEKLCWVSIVPNEFELPEQYTYDITKEGGLAKIINKPIEEQPQDEQPRDKKKGVIFFMTYRWADSFEGHKIEYYQDKPTTEDYFNWLYEKIENVRKERGTDAIITSHSVTGELNQK